MRQFELIAPCHFGLEAVLKTETVVSVGEKPAKNLINTVITDKTGTDQKICPRFL